MSLRRERYIVQFNAGLLTSSVDDDISVSSRAIALLLAGLVLFAVGYSRFAAYLFVAVLLMAAADFFVLRLSEWREAAGAFAAATLGVLVAGGGVWVVLLLLLSLLRADLGW